MQHRNQGASSAPTRVRRLCLACAALIALAAGCVLIPWLLRAGQISKRGDDRPAQSADTAPMTTAPPAARPTAAGTAGLEGDLRDTLAAHEPVALDMARFPNLMRIHGRVTDSAGTPVSDATVTWESYASMSRGRHTGEPGAATDAADLPLTIAELRRLAVASTDQSATDGSFLLWAPRTDVVLCASAAGHARTSLDVTIQHTVATHTKAHEEPLMVQVDVRLSAGARISGRITDAETGLAVAGVRVWASDGDQLEDVSAWIKTYGGSYTDETGDYVLSALHEGRHRVWVSGAGTAYLDTPRDERPTIVLLDGEHKAGVDLACERGGCISGRITDTAGTPVAGAWVWAVKWTRGIEHLQRRTRDEKWPKDLAVRSDTNGGYRTAGLVPGHSYILAATYPGVFAPFASLPILVSRDQPDHSVHVVLGFGSRVDGVVLWDDGTPAASVEVSLAPAQATMWTPGPRVLNGFQAASQTTESDGRFHFQSVGTGSYWLWATASGRDGEWAGSPDGTSAIEIEVNQHVPGLNLILHRPPPVEEPLGECLVHGRVVATDGSAVESASVRVTAPGDFERRSATSRSTTDAEGAFTVTARGYGPFSVHPLRLGFRSTMVSRVTPAETGIVLVLERLASISGRVVTPSGSAPERGFRVSAEWVPQSQRASQPEPTRGLEGSARSAHGTVRVGSTRELLATAGQADGTFVLEGVPIDVVAVVVRAHGFAIGRSAPIETTPGAWIEGVTIQLSVGGTVNGMVLSEDGQRVSHADVLLLPGEERHTFDFDLAWSTPLATATTDANGRFSLDRVEPGSYDICAAHCELGRSRPARVIVDGDVAVEAPLLELERVAALGVQVVYEPSRAPVSGALIWLTGDVQCEWAHTDPNGRVRFEGLAAGRYVVTVHSPRGAIPLRGQTGRYRLDLSAGEKSQVQISLGGGRRVYGRISGLPPGQSVDVLLERLDAGGPGPAAVAAPRVTNTTRVYSFEDVEPGRYSLQAPPYFAATIELSDRDLERNIQVEPRR